MAKTRKEQRRELAAELGRLVTTTAAALDGLEAVLREKSLQSAAGTPDTPEGLCDMAPLEPARFNRSITAGEEANDG